MKSIFLVTLFCLLMVGCGKGDTGAAGAQGGSGPTGASGSNGLAGQNGQDGQDGYGMVFTQTTATTCANGGSTLLFARDLNRNSVFDIEDDNIQSLTVCNGLNGTNGIDGASAAPSAFTPVTLLNPCGDAPGIYDEVFMKLSNGTVLVSFSDDWTGHNTRLSVITPGTYQTTDGDNCIFTINVSGNFTYENHHY